MDRDLFYKIVKDSFTEQQGQVYLTGEITEALQTETDETALLNQCKDILQSFFDSQFNLIEYNVQVAQALLQVCINYRKELKELEVQIINKAVQRKTTMLRQKLDQQMRLLREGFQPVSAGQLVKQNAVSAESGTVVATSDSFTAVLENEQAASLLTNEYQQEIVAVENDVLQLGLDESVGINYLARYQQLKTVYKERVLELYRLIKNVYIGGSLMYPSNVGIAPAPRPNFFLYDCNNWLQKMVERLNHRQSLSIYSSATFSVKSNNPGSLQNIRVAGTEQIPQLFNFHAELLELDTLECMIRDSETGTKQDFWLVVLELGIAEGTLIQNPHILSTVDQTEWKQMIATTKRLTLVFKAPNASDLQGTCYFNILNLKNILLDDITVKMSIAAKSVNGKDRTSIEDIFFFVKGKSVSHQLSI